MRIGGIGPAGDEGELLWSVGIHDCGILEALGHADAGFDRIDRAAGQHRNTTLAVGLYSLVSNPLIQHGG